MHPEPRIDEPTKPVLVGCTGLQQQSGTSVDINMAKSSVRAGRKLGTYDNISRHLTTLPAFRL
jgi:hypothetical protein